MLYPDATIWSSMLSMFRDHRPCGANVPVSNPNQFTPVRVTSWPFASTIFEPLACSGPFNDSSTAPAMPCTLVLMSDATRVNATITGTTMDAICPIRGRFRNQLLSEASMIRTLAHMAVKSGVNRAADLCDVLVARERDQSRARRTFADFAGNVCRADLRRLDVNKDDLRCVGLDQSNGLRAVPRGSHQKEAWHLIEQVDERIHELRMVANDDDSFAWNSSSP